MGIRDSTTSGEMTSASAALINVHKRRRAYMVAMGSYSLLSSRPFLHILRVRCRTDRAFHAVSLPLAPEGRARCCIRRWRKRGEEEERAAQQEAV